MIITVSREFGSGGAEIAHKLAEKLGIPCYDKSVAELTAATSEFSEESIAHAEDRVSGVFEYMSGIYSVENLPIYDRIYLAQRAKIIELARSGDCVIVGRCAAHILQDEQIDCFNVFIYAPIEERKKRIAERRNVDWKRAERLIKLKDDFRKNYYRRYAYAEWGSKKNYQLMINSSIGIDQSVEVIVAACKK